MRKRITRFAFELCAIAIAVLLATTAWTQSPAKEKLPLYTYVSEWAIPRAMWADYEKAEAATGESMNKFVTDGTLLSYGSYSVLNHQEGAPTHGSSFSAGSMVNLMKVLEGLRSRPDASGPIFAASKHWTISSKGATTTPIRTTSKTAISALASGNSRAVPATETAKS